MAEFIKDQKAHVIRFDHPQYMTVAFMANGGCWFKTYKNKKTAETKIKQFLEKHGVKE